MRQNGALWFFHRLTVAAVDQPACGVAADLSEVFAGENRQNAGHGSGGGCVDGFDDTVGHCGPGKNGCTFGVRLDVVGVCS